MAETKMQYDIAIIGAGPAGAVLAAELKESFRVLLIDKRCLTDPSRRYEKEKSCGGLLDKRAQKALAVLAHPLDEGILASPQVFALKGIDLDNHGMERCYQKQYVNIDRVRFDAALADRARQKADVELREETVACGLRPVEEGMEDPTAPGTGAAEGGRRTASWVVGADGGTSLVRRWLKAQGHGRREPKRYASLQEWYPMPEDPGLLYGGI